MDWDSTNRYSSMRTPPMVIESDKILFCDVDQTLVMWEGTTYTPHLAHIEMVKKFHERGLPVVVWSAGGYQWACRIVQELQLGSYITMICSKPAWFIDDLPSSHFMPEENRIYIKQEVDKGIKIEDT